MTASADRMLSPHPEWWNQGLRSLEAVQLDAADFDPETGAVRMRAGKRNEDRLCYVQGMGCTAVEVWLDVRGAEPGPLFLPLHRSGRLQPRRMREQSVYDILRRRAAEAGLPPSPRRPARRRRRHQRRAVNLLHVPYVYP